jgi:hypothetical protein
MGEVQLIQDCSGGNHDMGAGRSVCGALRVSLKHSF